MEPGDNFLMNCKYKCVKNKKSTTFSLRKARNTCTTHPLSHLSTHPTSRPANSRKKTCYLNQTLNLVARKVLRKRTASEKLLKRLSCTRPGQPRIRLRLMTFRVQRSRKVQGHRKVMIQRWQVLHPLRSLLWRMCEVNRCRDLGERTIEQEAGDTMKLTSVWTGLNPYAAGG